MVNKKDYVGGIEGDFYLGWQLMCDCYWGCDLFDSEIMDTVKKVIEEMTNLSANPSDLILVDGFKIKRKKHECQIT